MQTTFLILISTSIVVTTVINFIKPLYEAFFNKKVSWAISILLSLILWVIWAFSVKWYLEIELTNWALFLIWLAIWTWAGIFYDLWSIVQNTNKKDLPKIEK